MVTVNKRLMSVLIVWVLANFTLHVRAADRLPNFVIVFADDLGYGDIGPFGAQGYSTPNLDRMAAEGMRCTSFCVAQGVCSASRTALLTGCYPNRVGILGALGPASKIGIHADEMLIPEVLKQRGYATAIYGKWHLGHHKQFLPPQHGFDDYFGLPYSNDMWPFHPADRNFPDLPMIQGDAVIDAQVTPEEQTQLTTWYTEHAVKFIEAHRNQPFFLYVPHSMPHVPLYVSQKFKGQTKRGLFGDVISEVDWSVGQILDTLKRLELDQNTMVIFTSDNGPWLSYGTHAGTAGPLREGKGTAWEGGVRVPFVARWPGKISAGAECTELAATIDVLPTLAKLAGAPLPKHPIDGLDIWPLLAGDPQAKTPHEAYFYYWGRALHAVRSGQWKLHFPHPYRSFTSPSNVPGQPGKFTDAMCGLELYDLAADVGETKNVLGDHPDVVTRLQALAETMRKDLGDELQKRPGTGVRQPGRF
jgi:arylsulfatase A-like enzyme